MGLICGIDEAGRGPVIGPMIMAGVLIDEKKTTALSELGVKDSKLIPKEKRELLYDKILKIVHKFHIIVLTPKEIDDALLSENMNLNWLEAKAQAEILEKLSPKKAYIDCPSVNTEAFCNYLKGNLAHQVEIVMEHGADKKYLAASAASILAKVTRDREIKKLQHEHGDFGSGYPSDAKTKEFIKDNHELPIFRRSWKPWQKIQESKKQRSLGDF
ncbi:MAG: ribonuclease HII [Candidatus Nanoarchaeia archaeon]